MIGSISRVYYYFFMYFFFTFFNLRRRYIMYAWSVVDDDDGVWCKFVPVATRWWGKNRYWFSTIRCLNPKASYRTRIIFDVPMILQGVPKYNILTIIIFNTSLCLIALKNKFILSILKSLNASFLFENTFYIRYSHENE